MNNKLSQKRKKYKRKITKRNKKKNNKYTIFVVTINDSRFKKYKNNPMYKKWKGCIGKNLNPKFVEDTYITMWNASKKHKHNVAGCSESHLSLMKHIINNKINNVIVIEDDALIDLKD